MSKEKKSHITEIIVAVIIAFIIGEGRFANINFSLPDIAINSLPNSDVLKNSDLSLGAFPRPSCGDSLPTSKNQYPIKFYPLYIPYTKNNLTRIKTKFCTDSYVRKRKSTGETMIKVASFHNKNRLKSFQKLMIEEFGESYIGESCKRYYESTACN